MDNEAGYRNVLLHGKLHYMQMQMKMAPPPAPGPVGAAPPEKPNPSELQEAPIQGEGNVATVQ